MADIYPLRLGAVARRCCATPTPASGDAVVLKQLVAQGLRAQLRTGNLLTGQLYVALDFIGQEPARMATSPTTAR